MIYSINRFFFIVALFALNACSADAGIGRVNFSIPALSENLWRATGYPFKDTDMAYCVVDKGYNNIRVILEVRRRSKEAHSFIESTRSIKPGTIFSINSLDNSFRTYANNALTVKQSKAIINDLEKGQTIYLRWSEPHGGKSGRLNFTNQVKSKNFIDPYEECVGFIKDQIKENANE